MRIDMGNIGEEQEEIEFIPEREIPAEAPAEPAPVPVRQPEPV